MPGATHQTPPDAYLRKMQALLPPEEYLAFADSFGQPPHTGLRVNTLKVSLADFTSMSPFPLTPVGAFEPAAFAIGSEARAGRHPYHMAGLYYLQEPSAMVAATLLDPQPGELVLDISAAPGGKATHLSSLLNRTAAAGAGSVLRRTVSGGGLLVANDVVRNRATILAGNLARWGAANGLVMAEDPARLASQFGSVFDRVLVDAPCSGEGMFRRQAGIEWNERIVMACARRQDHLLETAATLVRPGGYLLYATCTFSPEENESVIARFLDDHAAFEIVEPSRYAGFDEGQPAWVDAGAGSELARAVRLWPHRFDGEGHFAALLRRSEQDSAYGAAAGGSFPIRGPGKDEWHIWRAFARETLAIDLPEERLHSAGGRLYLIPSVHPATAGLKLVRYGMLLGELRSGYFRPAAELALALDARDATGAINWPAEDDRVQRYLAGEDIAGTGPDGWVLVTVDGFGLGWAKRVGGRLKNHFPHHLRRVTGPDDA